MPAPEGEFAVFGGEYTSLQTALVVANISTYAIATAFLFLRIYTSAFINRRTDWGDCKICRRIAFSPLTFYTYSLPDLIMGRRRWVNRLHYDR